MQLAEAIKAWVEVHDSSLSSATKRDIGNISLSASDCGLAKLETSGLSAADRASLAATINALLSSSAMTVRVGATSTRSTRRRPRPG